MYGLIRWSKMVISTQALEKVTLSTFSNHYDKKVNEITLSKAWVEKSSIYATQTPTFWLFVYDDNCFWSPFYVRTRINLMSRPWDEVFFYIRQDLKKLINMKIRKRKIIHNYLTELSVKKKFLSCWFIFLMKFVG